MLLINISRKNFQISVKKKKKKLDMWANNPMTETLIFCAEEKIKICWGNIRECNPRLKFQVNIRKSRLLLQQFPLTGTTNSGGGDSEGREPKCFSSFILCFRFMMRIREKKEESWTENSDLCCTLMKVDEEKPTGKGDRGQLYLECLNKKTWKVLEKPSAVLMHPPGVCVSSRLGS